LKVAIYSRIIDDEQIPILQSFFNKLEDKNITTSIWKDFYEQIKDKITFTTTPQLFFLDSALDATFECVISLGGDGTLLDTIALVQDKGLPVLGINFGRLGFLANIGKSEIDKAIDDLISHSYVTDERTLIQVNANIPIFGNVPYGLNEFAIHKQDISSMIKIHTYLNGEFLNTYWADGLIVATPTGSTGYSLSCSGPIVFPDSGSFVITPVAPHNLNARPIVIPDTNIISFVVEGRMDNYICSLDARKQIVSKTVQIALKKQEFTMKLIRLNENNFLQTLRNKLNWGLDKRN
jgi:NAD+ kinase